MLSNAYFLAKFRFITAENEPAKSLQKFANFPNFANPNPDPFRTALDEELGAERAAAAEAAAAAAAAESKRRADP